MKIDGINVTVRIDVECPDNMGHSEVEQLVNEMNYNFSLTTDCESRAIVTEIYKINK